MEFKINNSWKLISGNEDSTNYHITDLPNEAKDVILPSYTHMYLEDHVGISWYQRDVYLEKLPTNDEIAFLCFERAEFYAEVSVNGQIAGTHAGSEDPFKFDVTSLLKKGNNRITARISKPTDIEIDGYTFGEVPRGTDGDGIFVPGVTFAKTGICGEVSIKYLPKVYIEDMWLEAFPDTGKICVRLNVVNKTGETQEGSLTIKSGRAPEGNVEISDIYITELCVGENKIERLKKD